MNQTFAICAICSICLILLPACTSSTGYTQARIAGDFGYRDTRLGVNRYHVTFLGNSTTELEEVDAFWNTRSSELCNNGSFRVEGYSNAFVNRPLRSPGAAESEANPVVGDSTSYLPYSEGTIRCSLP